MLGFCHLDMTVFASKNIAKEWFARWFVEKHATSSIVVLDFACGDAAFWPDVLAACPNVRYVGLDFHGPSIEKAVKRLAPLGDRAKAHHLDGSTALASFAANGYDMVTTFSSLEHVVDIQGFLKNMVEKVKAGGSVVVNYDDGHFVDPSLKARIHAFIAPYVFNRFLQDKYLKIVDDALVARQLDQLGCQVKEKWRFNLRGMKGAASDQEPVVNAALAYEVAMNQNMDWPALKKVTLSTTIIAEKQHGRP